jgi:DNA-binding HxlR family transcriptional regulator
MKSQKITKTAAMSDSAARRRRYDDACAAAHALDLIGERWALLVMRELMPGPKRFSDLRAGLPGISANVLTQRLEGLEAAGVLRRRRLPPPAAAQVYELTEWGYQAEPVLRALGRWAARSPAHDPGRPFSAASFVLSLRTMFDAGRAAGFGARVGLRLGAETFMARIAGWNFAIAAGPLDGADVTFIGTPSMLARAIYGGEPLAVLEGEGVLRVDGDRTIAERFVTLFPLPDKASAPAG